MIRPPSQPSRARHGIVAESYDLGWEGIVSKRLARRSGRSAHWVKVKNPKRRPVKREAEEDWGR